AVFAHPVGRQIEFHRGRLTGASRSGNYPLQTLETSMSDPNRNLPWHASPQTAATDCRRVSVEIPAMGESDMFKSIAIAAVVTSLIATEATSQSLRQETSAQIDQAMKLSVEDGWTAGGIVAVDEGGKPVFLRAYGRANLETDTPVTVDTVFRIGSLTKQFTA